MAPARGAAEPHPPSLEANRAALEELGVTPEELREQATERSEPRAFVAGYVETPDGVPIASLVYQTDYRSEEEWGVGQLRNAITSDDPRRFRMTRRARDLVGVFEDANAIVLSTRRLTEPLRWDFAQCRLGGDDFENYQFHYENARARLQEIDVPAPHLATVASLGQLAEEHGLPKPWPRRKADFHAALSEHIQRNAPPRDVWPGWFHYGQHLVLRAEGDGLAARILRRLRRAAQEGTLGLANGSDSPFATGLFIYDTRDETPGLVANREAAFDWHDARMAELEPVKEELKRKGITWFALGRPTEMERDGKRQVRYWLNGMSGRDYPQPFGWYTLEELRQLKFISDARERAAQDRREYEAVTRSRR